MALEAPTGEELELIATIAIALSKQFGPDAIIVAEHQAENAAGPAAERWLAIISHLREYSS